MIIQVLFHILVFPFIAGVLVLGAFSGLLAQNPSSKPKQAREKTPQPLVLSLEGIAEKQSGLLRSESANLDRELKEVFRKMSRKGMDRIELRLFQGEKVSSFSLALTVRNFVPVSSGAWDMQDVLSFQAMGDGPIYLNLSLLQGLLKPLTSFKSKVQSGSREEPFSIESWSVLFEKSNGQYIRFEGRFEDAQPIIQPSLFIKREGSVLEIKADGQNVTSALSHGTFPLPPLRILDGQFSSTKLVLEFFGKQ